jgi:hypothetical protein
VIRKNSELLKDKVFDAEKSTNICDYMAKLCYSHAQSLFPHVHSLFQVLKFPVVAEQGNGPYTNRLTD